MPVRSVTTTSSYLIHFSVSAREVTSNIQ